METAPKKELQQREFQCNGSRKRLCLELNTGRLYFDGKQSAERERERERERENFKASQCVEKASLVEIFQLHHSCQPSRILRETRAFSMILPPKSAQGKSSRISHACRKISQNQENIAE